MRVKDFCNARQLRWQSGVLMNGRLPRLARALRGVSSLQTSRPSWLARAGFFLTSLVLIAGSAHAEVPADSGKAGPEPSERADPFAGRQPAWCPRAQKWAERYVCDDAQLSALDLRMESSYFAALGRTATDARRAFQRQQLDWIQSWWIACGIGPYGTGVPLDTGSFRSCLQEKYSNRIVQLVGALPSTR